MVVRIVGMRRRRGRRKGAVRRKRRMMSVTQERGTPQRLGVIVISHNVDI